MIWYLLLSALVINFTHGYLLWSQRYGHKWSLSAHAVASRKNYILYVSAHVVGGLFFVLFAKEFFVNTHDMVSLYYLVLVNYVFEVTQAILPSKGKWEKPHTIVALLQWLCILTVGLLSIYIPDINDLARLCASLAYVGILSMILRANSRRSKLYYYQMIMVLLFYVSMLSLVVGS